MRTKTGKLTTSLRSKVGITEDCPGGCGEVTPVFRWQTFVTGKTHLRADCPRCGKFIRYVEQTRERVAMSSPTPSEGEPPVTVRGRCLLRCRHCGRTRPAGELFCPGCRSPWVVTRGCSSL